MNPFKLVKRGVLESTKNQDMQVMMEDGLRDFKSVDVECLDSPTNKDSVQVQNYQVEDPEDDKEDLEKALRIVEP